jgi:hypothetical protein
MRPAQKDKHGKWHREPPSFTEYVPRENSAAVMRRRNSTS